MRLWLVLIFAGVLTHLSAAVLITPDKAMAQVFGNGVSINKKSLLLSTSEYNQVTQKAKVKLTTKLYRAFEVHKGKERVGYAVVLNERVRTNNAAILYMMDVDGVIKGIEVITFNEPPEYIPSNIWMEQFKGKSAKDELHIGKDIPTITGATLSVRNITEGSRVALALYDIVLKP